MNESSAATTESRRTESISARWAAGIACVEIKHDRPDTRKRAYLRLSLDEARKLLLDLAEVIAEREE